MNIQFTARHFKAPSELQRFAEDSIQGLSHLYEGIVNAEIVLEDRPHGGDDKMAEVIISVYKEQLFAKEKSDDHRKSIQACVDKLERQLVKYKSRLHDGQRPHEKPEFIDITGITPDITDLTPDITDLP
ncbi:MAG: sigma 54 modulation protein/ribosomal protein [Chlorobi bacterium]|nr:sigma 54 modulation protein/ribosomal protein [Chlorobiota bacterium]